jgi:anti-sigma factor RsiW
MNDHDEMHKLLPLAAAGALEAQEQRQLEAHLRDCAACAAELERWSELGTALRHLPTPQPPALVIERVRARAEAELAAQAEGRWNFGMLVFLVLFSWTLTLASWPIVRLMTEGMFGWLKLQQTWLALAVYTAVAWLTAGVAAALLGLRQRAARRIV